MGDKMAYTEKHKEAQQRYREKQRKQGYFIYTKFVNRNEANKLNETLKTLRKGE